MLQAAAQSLVILGYAGLMFLVIGGGLLTILVASKKSHEAAQLFEAEDDK